jgi:hypothetical protein
MVACGELIEKKIKKKREEKKRNRKEKEKIFNS